MSSRATKIVLEAFTAFQTLDEAIQDVTMALPGQMTERAFRLDSARLAFRDTLRRLAYEAAGPVVDAEALGGAFGDVRRPEAP